MDLSAWEWLGRLAAAGALSGLIGFEREAHHKAAGLRTHMLVGVGAALFTLAGSQSFGAGDPSRVAAQVVTGIGFLGAGAIFRSGVSIRGLTTAAGLWVAAAIGVVAGAGDVLPAALAAALAVVTLNGLTYLEDAVRKRRDRRSVQVVAYFSGPGSLGAAMSVVTSVDERARECEVAMVEDGSVSATFLVTPPNADTVAALLAGIDGVTAVERTSAQAT
jgi:putative Mg2+ transporter-C (MgtC) family protein